MSGWSRWPALRWLVPAAAVALVLGGGAAATAIATSARPDLPPRTAAELLVDLQTARVGGLSGTVVQTAELGLPLPDPGRRGDADLAGLWSGSNTLRVWYDGPERVRVALLGTLSQSDIIRNGRDLWIWHSRRQQASHRTLPERLATGPASPPGHPSLTPPEAADAALAALDPTTAVRVADPVRVAGRDAYQLVLAPRDGASLVREVRLAIDAEHSLPLQVQAFGAGPDPAFEVRFTQLSFQRPDPEQFRFNPPPGTEVTEEQLLPSLPFGLPGAAARPRVTVVGEGWTAVLVARLPAAAGRDGPVAGRDGPLAGWDGLLAGLPVVGGDWGSGRVLAGELFSVLLADDGRILVGAVTPERLAEAAGDPAAALAGG
jgi:outer membrane lipoprotein-sorting protein